MLAVPARIILVVTDDLCEADHAVLSYAEKHVVSNVNGT
jgi:hypothetical protein